MSRLPGAERLPGMLRNRILELTYLGAAAATLVVRLLPGSSVGIFFKLLVVVPAMTLLPGLAVVRLLGTPSRFSDAIGPAFAWSAVIAGLGLLVTVTFDANLSLGIGTALAVSVLALLAGWRKSLPAPDAEDLQAALVVLGSGCVLGALIWVNRYPLQSDALEHLARIRKLAEMPRLVGLSSANVVGPGAGLHPGYAFPMWHAVLAFVARVANLDPAPVVQYAPVFMAPPALMVAYAAGARMFRSRALGLVTAGMLVAWLGLPWQGAGFYRELSYPGFASILIFTPAALALVFAYLEEGGRPQLASLVAVGVVLAVIHVSYAPFVFGSLVAFGVLRWLITRERKEAVRVAACAAILILPFLLYVSWLLPVINDRGSTKSPEAERLANIQIFRTLIDTRGEGPQQDIRMKAGFISRGGAAIVLGLLVAPIALFGYRNRWAAYVLATMSVDLALLMLYPLFTHLIDFATLSQSRRLVFYLPIPFALAGAVSVLGRRWWAAIAALAAGIFLQLSYPGDFFYQLSKPGPGWVAWWALVGCALAAVAAVFWRRGVPTANSTWAVVTAAAFILPIGVGGVLNMRGVVNDKLALPPAFVTAVREDAPAGSVIFAPQQIGFRLAAEAPVYSVAVTQGHGGNTKTAKLDQRLSDVGRFFTKDTLASEAESLVQKYDSDYLVVDTRLPYPHGYVRGLQRSLIFGDGTLRLYRLP